MFDRVHIPEGQPTKAGNREVEIKAKINKTRGEADWNWLFSSLTLSCLSGTVQPAFCYLSVDLYRSNISTTNLDACVCLCAKFDQFLPVRSQFDSNQHVNSVRIATFQSANFGPLLFAFYCPLLFYENKIKNE